MSGHCAARSYLNRFRIVEELMCVCLNDYETVKNLIWHCKKFEIESVRLTKPMHSLDLMCSSGFMSGVFVL
jgi:hypothetical protein